MHVLFSYISGGGGGGGGGGVSDSGADPGGARVGSGFVYFFISNTNFPE